MISRQPTKYTVSVGSLKPCPVCARVSLSEELPSCFRLDCEGGVIRLELTAEDVLDMEAASLKRVS